MKRRLCACGRWIGTYRPRRTDGTFEAYLRHLDPATGHVCAAVGGMFPREVTR